MLVKHTSGHLDYFRADKAWFYIVLLTIGYLGSRGRPKSGSRDHHKRPARLTKRAGRNSTGMTAGVEVRRRGHPVVASRAPNSGRTPVQGEY
jgi:hypothetical protein